MALNKKDINDITKMIQELYLEDNIPWICGYSGGKDSSAIVQLVWYAIASLPEEQRSHKKVYVISTDTLVESPVIATWAEASLTKMERKAAENKMLILPRRLTPKMNNTYWVNLIGRGYPYPRKNFRWCTDRLKIEPSNSFIKSVLDSENEAILVLGTRKAESKTRREVMEEYEKKRYRAHLSKNGSFANSYVFTPIENCSDDEVWQYLMQYENPWGHSNKELLAMYSGASQDGECPLVLDTSSPSCGNSRFGCWVCTLVSEDRSMAAMIQNDSEKAWMQPLLDFRNDIAGRFDEDGEKVLDTDSTKKIDRERRDFRRKDGRLTWQNEHLVHGPYEKEVREYFLRKLLELEQFIRLNGPEEVKNVCLIRQEELQNIRNIWLNEKHEFEDSLPKIYYDVTGNVYEDDLIVQNRYYSKEEWDLLKLVCKEEFPDEELMLELQSSLLDITAKESTMSRRKNISKVLEKEILKCAYKDEPDALKVENERRNANIINAE